MQKHHMAMSQEQDNTKVSQVKETVKQQLFRAIIKQATSELSSIDEAELSARLGEMNLEAETSALQERLKMEQIEPQEENHHQRRKSDK